MANPMKTMPPIIVTALTLIFFAKRAPHRTASPVQMVWPRTPPIMIPATSLTLARTIVAS